MTAKWIHLLSTVVGPLGAEQIKKRQFPKAVLPNAVPQADLTTALIGHILISFVQPPWTHTPKQAA